MYFEKSRRQVVFNDKGHPHWDKCKQVGEADLKGYDIIKRVYSRQGKSPTLTTMQGGWRMPKVQTDELHWRALTPLECERLQTLPDGWTQYGEFDHKYGYLGEVKPISNSQRYKMIGNGFTRAVISHILEGVYT
jgi:site-specific DNA-cytosine methylase